MAQAPTSQMVCEIRSPLLAKHLAGNGQRLDHRGRLDKHLGISTTGHHGGESTPEVDELLGLIRGGEEAACAIERLFVSELATGLVSGQLSAK
jgi:hypothetical protein